MSFNKTDLVIALITVVIGLILSIIVGVTTHDPVATVLTGFGSVIVGLFIDLRINQYEIAHQPENPLLTNYTKVSNSNCPLFKKVAMDKQSEIDTFYANLAHDIIEVDSLHRVYELLKFLFCDLQSIKEIYATSYGEMSEWRDVDSWWGGNYLSIHDVAHKRGAKITRIIIVHSDEEKESVHDVLDANVAHKVIVKTALARRISSSDLERVGNCLIFLNGKKELVYCLLANHNSKGDFVKALIYRDQEHMMPILEAYKRIETISTSCQDSKKPTLTTNLVL